MRAVLGELVTGPAGTARQVHVQLERRDPVDQAGTLASWFLTCPGQSAGWDRYALHVVHLRPIDGGRPVVINVPGATHEVMLAALDPRRLPRPEKPTSWSYLEPFNVAQQVHLPDDAAAVELLAVCAVGVVEGALWAEPPLAGQLEPWRTALIQTAAHARGEAHGDLSAGSEPQL